jgi:hypothetical protein
MNHAQRDITDRVLFVIAAFPVASRINLAAAGLACWVLSNIVTVGLLR